MKNYQFVSIFEFLIAIVILLLITAFYKGDIMLLAVAVINFAVGVISGVKGLIKGE